MKNPDKIFAGKSVPKPLVALAEDLELNAINDASGVGESNTQMKKTSYGSTAALVMDELMISYNTYLIQVRKAA